MRYHGITGPDISNGEGCRITLWISGCHHKCTGCQNMQTWSLNSGIPWTEKSYKDLVKMLDKPYISGLTLSGGDPLSSYEDVVSLLEKIKIDLPNKTVWLYTGYTIEEVKSNYSKVLPYVDVIVDGRFEVKNRDITLPFRGSTNQKIYKIIKDSWGRVADITLYEKYHKS